MRGPPPDARHIIRAWRGRIGLTQEELARALSVTFSTVNRWENGHVRPSNLAWNALEKVAAERGSSLLAVGGEDASSPLGRSSVELIDGFFDEPSTARRASVRASSGEGREAPARHVPAPCPAGSRKFPPST